MPQRVLQRKGQIVPGKSPILNLLFFFLIFTFDKDTGPLSSSFRINVKDEVRRRRKIRNKKGFNDFRLAVGPPINQRVLSVFAF